VSDQADQPESKPKRRLGPFRRFLGIFGVRYPQERGKWVVLTTRFRIIMLVLLIGLVALFAGFFHYSSKPEFCNSCHFMDNFTASWKDSSHSQVPCNDCHFPPGWRNVMRAKVASSTHIIKTITHTASIKPRAEIDDASCLREGCHETRLLDGEVVFKDKYKFDHGLHLTELRRGKKLRCTSCHSQMVQGKHISVTESTCFTCHFKGRVHDRLSDPIAGCTSCHDSPVEPIQLAGGGTFDHKAFLDREVQCWKCHFDSIQGTGDVPRQVCITCHSDTAKLEKYNDSRFMHNWHVTQRKVECFQCHSEIRHGLHPEFVEGDATCARCHSMGHNSHSRLYSGQGGRGVEGEPSGHFTANVDCVACHEMPSPEDAGRHMDIITYKTTEQACVECHGKRIEGTLEEWESVLVEMLDETRQELAKAEKAYQVMPDDHPQKAEAKALLETAQYNSDFVGKAHGVHNIEYAMELLDNAAESAASVARIARTPASEEPDHE